MSPSIAVIYYSSTGNVHRLAAAVAEGAAQAEADVRLRRVPELAGRRHAWCGNGTSCAS